jgi:uncharacterized protein YyaL (SSP411 family)
MNKLSAESSPYLLQHKDNPVNWFAWSEEAWEKARIEDKLVLVSIGYSSCHWCHVMEHEVFEDFECAEYMNMHFVCIKVDREERPDIDSIYMDAIHLMGSKGGWPLNVFALPDGRPVYGGTYFPKQHWLSVLENLHDLYTRDRSKVIEYAARLHAGLSQLAIIPEAPQDADLDGEFVDKVIEHWSQFWDLEKGGARKAPKFPMPSNIDLLLHYGAVRKDRHALGHAFNTLKKMALGGIFDQCGGGFARYSVDDIWKVPHFEKMLYDNAQLLAVYARAHRLKPDALYTDTIRKTSDWLNREMKSAEGLYYAALDADSEGEEGKFYTWTEKEVRELFGDDAAFVCRYYRIGKEGWWEHDNNILLRTLTDEEFAESEGITVEDLRERIIQINDQLLGRRSQRVRPGLDHKCIASWNAMLVSGFCECYKATFQEEYKAAALNTFQTLIKLVVKEDGQVWHQVTDGIPSIDGFLDDYAFLAAAALDLYEITFDEDYVSIASDLADIAISEFFSSDNSLLYYTTRKNLWLTRKQEVQDNVIPSSNSAMANVLFRLSKYVQSEEWEERSKKMLICVLPQVDFASGYSNWLQLFMRFSYPHFEIAICGNEISRELKSIQSCYLPQSVLAASTMQSELPLLKNRFRSDTTIYVCSGRSCFPPMENAAEAIQLIDESNLLE